MCVCVCVCSCVRVCVCVCVYVCVTRPSNGLVYLRDESAQTSVLRLKLQIKLPHPVTVYRHRASQSQC